MRTAFTALALCLGLVALPATAQPEVLFGSGQPPVFKEEELDRRFLQSKVAYVLDHGAIHPACAQVAGALLTLLGEVGPYLHRRDENFYLEPMLGQALKTQLVSPRFSGAPYLVAMVRRVLIHQRLPAEWLSTAEGLANQYSLLDLARLRFLADGPEPIDSFLATLPALRERYELEVKRANSLAASRANSLFREGYLDKEVTFSGVSLVDVKREKKRKRRGEPPQPPTLMARLTWKPPEPTHQMGGSDLGTGLSIFPSRKRVVVTINARLAEKQYVDFDRLPKGTRLLVRGRFWEYRKGFSELELRNAYLFEDRDLSRGVQLITPAVVAACPMALNELTGEAPQQPQGFGYSP